MFNTITNPGYIRTFNKKKAKQVNNNIEDDRYIRPMAVARKMLWSLWLGTQRVKVKKNIINIYIYIKKLLTWNQD